MFFWGFWGPQVASAFWFPLIFKSQHFPSTPLRLLPLVLPFALGTPLGTSTAASGITLVLSSPPISWPGRGGIQEGSRGFGLRRMEEQLSTRLCLKGGSFSPLLLQSQALGVLSDVLVHYTDGVWITLSFGSWDQCEKHVLVTGRWIWNTHKKKNSCKPCSESVPSVSCWAAEEWALPFFSPLITSQ